MSSSNQTADQVQKEYRDYRRALVADKLAVWMVKSSGMTVKELMTELPGYCMALDELYKQNPV